MKLVEVLLIIELLIIIISLIIIIYKLCMPLKKKQNNNYEKLLITNPMECDSCDLTGKLDLTCFTNLKGIIVKDS